MRQLLVFPILVGLAGCGSNSSSSDSKAPPKSNDSNIRVKESLDGRAGPVGGNRTREYEGPASQAPDWAKPKSGGSK